MKPINRCLPDKAMDEMDHALGRPLDPQGETYRNFFTVDGPQADEMASSPYWSEGRRQGSGLRAFCVTDIGRAALARYLREIGDPHRAFIVTYAGLSRTIIAENRDKARYSHYLDLTDVLSDLTFKDYCRRTTVAAA